MLVVHSPEHRRHDPSVEMEASTANSPREHGGRVEAIRAALESDARFELRLPVDHGLAPILAVHEAGLVRFLEAAWVEYQESIGPAREVVPDVFHLAGLRDGMGPAREPANIAGRLGWWCFETTTPIVEGTYAAARSAVDVAIDATDLVLGGERSTYGLCRPPGHHATRSLYGGYCFFNNAAVAAQHAVASAGARVTVLDVDYHHGNGTQQIFYERGDVQYVSLHGDPERAYPFTVGFADELGSGAGAGANLNIPLPARLGDDGYLGELDRALQAVSDFGPDLLVVSLGLDTYETDPICDLSVTTDGFARCGGAVGALGLPTVVLQEGGYDVEHLGENARRWLGGLLGEDGSRRDA